MSVLKKQHIEYVIDDLDQMIMKYKNAIYYCIQTYQSVINFSSECSKKANEFIQIQTQFFVSGDLLNDNLSVIQDGLKIQSYLDDYETEFFENDRFYNAVSAAGDYFSLKNEVERQFYASFASYSKEKNLQKLVTISEKNIKSHLKVMQDYEEKYYEECLKPQNRDEFLRMFSNYPYSIATPKNQFEFKSLQNSKSEIFTDQRF